MSRLSKSKPDSDLRGLCATPACETPPPPGPSCTPPQASYVPPSPCQVPFVTPGGMNTSLHLVLSSDDSSTMLSPPPGFCDNVMDISILPPPDQFGDVSILSESVEMDPDDPLLCLDSPPAPDNTPSTPAMENMLSESGTEAEGECDTFVELEETVVKREILNAFLCLCVFVSVCLCLCTYVCVCVCVFM